MTFTTITFPGIGPVRLEKSQRARHVSITIKPDRGIRVAVPMNMSFKKAEELVHTKIDWIKKHRQKIDLAHHKSQQFPGIKMSPAAAKLMLSQHLLKLAEHYGFSVNKVSIRNQKTRWGSCSVVNNISLNIKLAALPPELVHYVLCHELVHTRIKNHGPQFWKELEKYVPNARKVNKQLRYIKPGLIQLI